MGGKGTRLLKNSQFKRKRKPPTQVSTSYYEKIRRIKLSVLFLKERYKKANCTEQLKTVHCFNKWIEIRFPNVKSSLLYL